MTHLPYIAGAYGLTLALAAWLSLSAMLRLSRARTRLRAVEQGARTRGRQPPVSQSTAGEA